MLSSQNLDRDAQITSGELQLKSFGSFFDQHDSRLSELLSRVTNDHTDCFNSNLDNLQLNVSVLCPTVNLVYTPPDENITLFQLTDSDNKVLNKVLLTFVQICDEAIQLKSIAYRYQMKLLYCDEHLCAYEEKGHTAEYLCEMSNLLELLYSVQYLTQRCIVVARMILQQLGALFSCKSKDENFDLQLPMQFQEVFNRLGDVILQLIVFDEILASSNFQNFWQTYKKAVHSVSRNLDRFNQSAFAESEVNGLANILNSLEIMLGGHLFQAFLDSTFKIKEQISTKAFPELSGHFQDYIRVNLASIEKFPSALSDFDEPEMIIKINAICVLFHNFFGQLEQKTFKHLGEINAKNIGITLIGNLIWNPEQFLKKHAQTLSKNYDVHIQERTRLRQTYLETKIQSIWQDSRYYCSQILKWSLQMNGAFKCSLQKYRGAHFKHLCNLFLQGIRLAGQLSNMIKSITNLHVLLHMKMTKPTLLAICKLMEYLKVVQVTFQNNSTDVAKSIMCVMQCVMYKVLFLIATVKKKLSTQNTRNDRNLDTLSALLMAEKCIYGPATKSRILIASLAINFANPMRVISPEHLQKLHKLVNRLDILSDLQINLDHLCDSSFLYWHQSILSVYMKQMIGTKNSNTTGYMSMKYLVQFAEDCSKKFEMNYATKNLETIKNFRDENYKQYRHEIAVKLCAQIETFLRIHVHENLAQIKPDPFSNGSDDDCRDLINVCPVELNGKHVILKDQIENYLSNLFYNLTTISLHDWRTYSEMRHLGNYKFSLVTIDDYLPTQQLEQGIDVLEIMRHIHVFVSKYLYNMNNQIFIECTSNNKHLNTIGIRHIANSLRTHGTGIINTTVNFTYQFLRKKLYTFSQFLYDEHIKSRLMKDLKYFRGGGSGNTKDRSSSTLPSFSYERAESFNKGIRKFGLTPDGQSYLDLFRQLISHIGNAMGYIRLMRSGGIHASSDVSIYLPKIDENLDFAKLATENELSASTQTAGDNLENNIRSLLRCFSDETEYFKLLIEAFAPFFRDPKNSHLRNFYLTIPALTINFVEYIINAKDKIHKRDKHGVLFVDDGFAIGLTYLVRLLNQTVEFDSLHWFNSVKQHYRNERSKIIAQREQIKTVAIGGGGGNAAPNAGGIFTNLSSDNKLEQTLALTEKRINAHQIEFNLLYYKIQSSKIFFQ